MGGADAHEEIAQHLTDCPTIRAPPPPSRFKPVATRSWLGTSSGTFWTQAGRVGAGQSTSSTAAGGLAMAGGYVFRVGSATGAVSILGSQAAGYTVPNNITGTFASGASSGSANSAG